MIEKTTRKVKEKNDRWENRNEGEGIGHYSLL